MYIQREFSYVTLFSIYIGNTVKVYVYFADKYAISHKNM